MHSPQLPTNCRFVGGWALAVWRERVGRLAMIAVRRAHAECGTCQSHARVSRSHLRTLSLSSDGGGLEAEYLAEGGGGRERGEGVIIGGLRGCGGDGVEGEGLEGRVGAPDVSLWSVNTGIAAIMTEVCIVCVCVCACVCVCVHVYIYTYSCVCVCVCVCVFMYTCIHIYVWICIHTRMYMYLYMYACMHTRICTHIC